jgi:hypothetical protein
MKMKSNINNFASANTTGEMQEKPRGLRSEASDADVLAAKAAVVLDVHFKRDFLIEIQIQEVEDTSLLTQLEEPCPAPAAARSTRHNTPKTMKKNILFLTLSALVVVAVAGCERHSEQTAPPAVTNAMPGPAAPEPGTPSAPAGNESTNANNPAPENPVK